MKKILTAILAMAMTLALCCGAGAEGISFDAAVKPAYTAEVYVPLGGTVERVNVSAGDMVKAGDVLATLMTVKVYAQEDGVVTAVNARPGDDAAAVNTRYGAAVLVEGAVRYTITANLNTAYSSVATTFVQPGQQVYLRGRNNATHTGTGVITIVDTSSYTVEVTSGEFTVGESVNIFMSQTANDNARLGRGNATRRLPDAAGAEAGVIVNVPVKVGDEVKRGDLLLETLGGSANGLAADGNAIAAGVDGVVASVALAQGTACEQNTVAAVIYPADAMCLEGLVAESDLGAVRVGAKVSIAFVWNEDTGATYEGVVSAISALSDAESAEVSYRVCVSFTPDENIRYGMTAEVTVK